MQRRYLTKNPDLRALPDCHRHTADLSHPVADQDQRLGESAGVERAGGVSKMMLNRN